MLKTRIALLGVCIALPFSAGMAYHLYSDSDITSNDVTATTALGPDKVEPDDHVMGNPNAPVVVVEYFAQICSFCARFNAEVFPQLKAKYIDTGKVRYVMRLFPMRTWDGPSYRLDMCVPPDRFFQTVDLLFHNQPQWDADEYPGVDAQAGLIKMARILGFTPEQASACMSSTKLDASINKVSQDAVSRYQINSTPSFVINFRKVSFPQNSWADVQAAINAALDAMGVK